MKQVGNADVVELGIGIGSAASLAYAFVTAANPGTISLCLAVLLLLVASWRKTRRIRAQLIEIVDDQGYTRACIGYANVGLSFAVSKAEVMNSAVIPMALFKRAPFVQDELGGGRQRSDDQANRVGQDVEPVPARDPVADRLERIGYLLALREAADDRNGDIALFLDRPNSEQRLVRRKRIGEHGFGSFSRMEPLDERQGAARNDALALHHPRVEFPHELSVQALECLIVFIIRLGTCS